MTFNVWDHGGDDTLIHPCVNSSSGSLRTIDSDGDCRNNETPLDLSGEASGGLTGVERVSEVIEILWPQRSFYLNWLIARPGNWQPEAAPSRSMSLGSLQALLQLIVFQSVTLLRDGRPICMRALDLAQERRRSPSKCLLSRATATLEIMSEFDVSTGVLINQDARTFYI